MKPIATDCERFPLYTYPKRIPRRVGLSLIWSVATFLLIFISEAPAYPTVFPDELCRLAWARWYTGSELYALGPASYCQPIYPLLLVPFYLISEDPEFIPEAIFYINSGFAASCLPLAWTLARNHFNSTPVQAGIAAALVFIFPALTLHSHHAWPETMLYPALILTFTLFCRWIEQRTWSSFVWMVIISVFLYGLHRKMLVFPLTLTVGISASLFLAHSRLHRQRGLLALLLIIVSIYLFETMRKHAMAAFWRSGDLDLVGKLTAGSLPDLLLSLGSHASGILLYGGIVTGGLVWVVLAHGLRLVAKNMGQGHLTSLSNNELKWLWAPSAFILLLFLSAYFVSTSDRFDALFYGRHVNPALAICVLSGFLLIARSKLEAQTALIAILVASFSLFLFSYTVDGPPWGRYSPIHVNGAAPYMDFLHSLSEPGKFSLGVALFTVPMLLVIMAVFPSPKRFLSLVPFLAFTSFTHVQTAPFSRPPPEQTYPEAVRAQLESEQCEIIWDSTIQPPEHHHFWRLQYHFNKCGIEAEPITSCAGTDKIIITDRNLTDCPRSAEKYSIPPSLHLIKPDAR